MHSEQSFFFIKYPKIIFGRYFLYYTKIAFFFQDKIESVENLYYTDNCQYIPEMFIYIIY
ncbi:MAG: hypothetical protein A2086_15660 [Spirochaetes bacterium GWD1_27_9]|nr:MAG: hypothetical protein A2086_15660 [Spirochaetes bacterium GWD1_27_9]